MFATKIDPLGGGVVVVYSTFYSTKLSSSCLWYFILFADMFASWGRWALLPNPQRFVCRLTQQVMPSSWTRKRRGLGCDMLMWHFFFGCCLIDSMSIGIVGKLLLRVVMVREKQSCGNAIYIYKIFAVQSGIVNQDSLHTPITIAVKAWVLRVRFPVV